MFGVSIHEKHTDVSRVSNSCQSVSGVGKKQLLKAQSHNQLIQVQLISLYQQLTQPCEKYSTHFLSFDVLEQI